MSKLPDPKGFNNHVVVLHKSITFDSDVTDEEKKEILQKTYKAINKNRVYKFIFNILNKRFLDSIDDATKQKVYQEYLRYDYINNSPCVLLCDNNNDIKSIAVHRTKDGKKWLKRKGSDGKYVHHNIFDFVVYVAYGMGELLILELLQLPYIAFQSDGVAHSLDTNKQFNEEVKPLLKDKLVVMLLDNDNTCLNTVAPIQENLKGISKLCLPIQMIDLLVTSAFYNDTDNRASQEARNIWKQNQTLDAKYDFKDYVLNEFSPENIKDIVYKTIENKIKGIL